MQITSAFRRNGGDHSRIIYRHLAPFRGHLAGTENRRAIWDVGGCRRFSAGRTTAQVERLRIRRVGSRLRRAAGQCSEQFAMELEPKQSPPLRAVTADQGLRHAAQHDQSAPSAGSGARRSGGSSTSARNRQVSALTPDSLALAEAASGNDPDSLACV